MYIFSHIKAQNTQLTEINSINKTIKLPVSTLNKLPALNKWNLLQGQPVTPLGSIDWKSIKATSKREKSVTKPTGTDASRGQSEGEQTERDAAKGEAVRIVQVRIQLKKHCLRLCRLRLLCLSHKWITF